MILACKSEDKETKFTSAYLGLWWEDFSHPCVLGVFVLQWFCGVSCLSLVQWVKADRTGAGVCPVWRFPQQCHVPPLPPVPSSHHRWEAVGLHLKLFLPVRQMSLGAMGRKLFSPFAQSSFLLLHFGAVAVFMFHQGKERVAWCWEANRWCGQGCKLRQRLIWSKLIYDSFQLPFFFCKVRSTVPAKFQQQREIIRFDLRYPGVLI